jgi:hypothetical protein
VRQVGHLQELYRDARSTEHKILLHYLGIAVRAVVYRKYWQEQIMHFTTYSGVLYQVRSAKLEYTCSYYCRSAQIAMAVTPTPLNTTTVT